ncbi:MAG: twin-arginine translocase TatA/TatE family subunit [Zetaproteobacteria bacterium]|nr:twin-arginine translocase TatA/TatE family subunit [Zetaproteobacteria bacterium]
MPDIGFLELLVVGAIAFLILGPERAPEFFAQIGRMMRQGRGWIADVKRQIEQETQALKEPLQETKDALDDGISSMDVSLKKNNDSTTKHD